MHLAKTLEKRGFAVTSVPVYGSVKLDELTSGKTPSSLPSCMPMLRLGMIQNIEEIAKKGRGIVFHTDVVASEGTIPVDVKRESMSLAANQFYVPEGPEDVPAIVGMGKAAELALLDIEQSIYPACASD